MQKEEHRTEKAGQSKLPRWESGDVAAWAAVALLVLQVLMTACPHLHF